MYRILPDPSGTAGPQLQPRTLTNSIGDPDLRSYVRNDDNVPPPKIAPPVFLSAAPQVLNFPYGFTNPPRVYTVGILSFLG